MAENIIPPRTPEQEGVRRSSRTRFKSSLVTGQVNTVTHQMLTDDMIKNGQFGFSQFQLNPPAHIGKPANTRNVLNLKSGRDREPVRKPKKKNSMSVSALKMPVFPRERSQNFCIFI